MTPPTQRTPGLAVLEGLATAVLALVVVAVIWMCVASYDADLVGPGAGSTGAIVGVIALLTAALGLVSAVAVVQTRGQGPGGGPGAGPP